MIYHQHVSIAVATTISVTYKNIRNPNNISKCVSAPFGVTRNVLKLLHNQWISILIIKPTRCTNFSNLFLGKKSTCFGQFLCPSSGVFHCTHSKPVWHIPLLCVQWKTPDAGQRNCLKHVEFYPKNKFEKSVHLVDFIIRIYHDARSPERQTLNISLILKCNKIQFFLKKKHKNLVYWFK